MVDTYILNWKIIYKQSFFVNCETLKNELISNKRIWKENKTTNILIKYIVNCV